MFGSLEIEHEEQTVSVCLCVCVRERERDRERESRKKRNGNRPAEGAESNSFGVLEVCGPGFGGLEQRKKDILFDY